LDKGVTVVNGATLFIVDDNHGTRMALSYLLEAAGYQVRSFESAESFLKEQDSTTPGCLLLDVCMPGLSGLELQRLLGGSPNARPIIFLTGTDDIEDSVLAMKQGAVDFLTKPIDDMRLFAAVEQALRRDSEQRRERTALKKIQQRVDTLTPREQQVMGYVIGGRLNKQIAWQMGIGVKTVKIHRWHVMSKMGVRSVAELTQLAMRIGIAIEHPASIGASALDSPPFETSEARYAGVA
jgi:FixJ family two-component response regulator